MSWGLKFVYFINILVIIATFFAYLAPMIDPSITWFFSFFGLGYPILLLLNVMLAIFWLMTKAKLALLSAVTIILGISPMVKTIGFSSPKVNVRGLDVMSYNIGYSRFLFNGKEGKKKVKEFKALIKKENPEIICLQERAKADLDTYDAIFDGYTLYPDEFLGTAIYSKLPIIDSGNISFDTKAHNATWLDLEYNKKKFRVYCIHLSSNKVKNFKDNIKEIWDESIYILDKYNVHSIIRVKQLKEILTHARTSPFPVLITGDFNDMPQSYVYRMIAKEYKDAFIEHGSGLVKTYDSRLPGLRIDYAFTSEELNVANLRVIKTNLSDHYPIVCTLDL
jgi:endonuclease/exonuclease/phosphatase family metal-dependent hydrolase